LNGLLRIPPVEVVEDQVEDNPPGLG
jgi:hypothetical protein